MAARSKTVPPEETNWRSKASQSWPEPAGFQSGATRSTLEEAAAKREPKETDHSDFRRSRSPAMNWRMGPSPRRMRSSPMISVKPARSRRRMAAASAAAFRVRKTPGCEGEGMGKPELPGAPGATVAGLP